MDPNNQYQQYLHVLLQVPSGIDPLNPPNFNQKLTKGGTVLEITVPVLSVLSSSYLLLHRNTSWMRETLTSTYKNMKQMQLGGLGSAIAQINMYLSGQPWTTLWKLPLSEPCEEIVGNYSFTNFPAKPNSNGMKHFPVLVKFKMKTAEQSVKQEATINASCWESDLDDLDDVFELLPVSKKACYKTE